MRTDPQIQSLVRPLTDEEKKDLESQIRRDGCIAPLVVWESADGPVLVDGHHRREICERLGVRYETVSVSFASIDEAIAWVAQHQLGRRNLSPRDASYLRGLVARKTAEKTILDRRSKINLGDFPEENGANSSNLQNSDSSKSDPKGAGEVDAEIAAKYGVSDRQIRRDRRYAEAVDRIVDVLGEDVRPQLLAGKLGDMKQIEKLTGAPAAKIMRWYDRVSRGQNASRESSRGTNASRKSASREDANQEIPPALQVTFAIRDRAKAIHSALRSAKKIYLELAELAGGEYLRRHIMQFTAAVATAHSTLKFSVPHSVCDRCKGKGCEACQKLGWLNAQQARTRERFVEGR